MDTLNRKVRRLARRCAGVMLASSLVLAPTAWNVLADSGVDYEDRTNDIKNVMYYGDWSIWGGQGEFYPGGIPADQLTHLNFAFLDFDAAGELIFTDSAAAMDAAVGMEGVTWAAPNAGILNALQDLRAKNPNLRVGVSLGGWSKSGDFSALAASPTARANFVNNVMKFIEYTGMDFVDLDWEYPNSVRVGDGALDEGTPNANPADVQNYIILLNDLRVALDAKELEDGKTYELSVALPASPATLAAGIDVQALFDVVDYANIMTYDLHGAWDPISGHHTALYTNPADPNAALGLSVDDAVNYLIDEGAPSEKIVIGAAFYTRGWAQVTDNGGVAGMPGLFGSAIPHSVSGSDNISFGALDALFAEIPDLTRYWDNAAKAPYLYSPSTGAFYTYDDEQSVGEKAQYVLDNNLGGVISWMQSNDAESVPGSGRRDVLTTAIKQGLFGNGDLAQYNIVTPDLDVTVNVTTYSDASGNGYEFAITNNEVSNETKSVLTSVETSAETVKSPKLYIHTQSGATFTSGGYGTGTVTNENGWGIADVASVYDNKFFEQGETTIIRLGVNGTVSLDDIDSIELAQRIIPTGAEISRQALAFTVNGDIPDETTTDSTNPTDPIDNGDYAEYDPSVAYNAGDRVSYNGSNYEAKWWTQGDVPGASEWGPWLLID